MALVVIVCGYDRISDLDEYTGRVAALLSGTPAVAVIASGGFTIDGLAHSEAWLMARVLESSLPGVTVLLEERSMNTLDNLMRSREIVRERFGLVEEIEVYCDHAHRAKVSLLCRLLFGRRATVTSVHRDVPSIVKLLEPFSMLAECLAVVIPVLRPILSRMCALTKGVSGRAPRSVLRTDA